MARNYMQGFAFGPNPARVLSQPEAIDLVKKAAKTFESDERKRGAYKRFQVWSGRHRDLIVDRIHSLYSTDDRKRETAKFVNITNNIALDITQQISVVWDTGAIREVASTPPDQVTALNSLLNEGLFDLYAPSWNQLAWFQGPVVVLPFIRDGVLRWDTVLPHFSDLIRNPADPWGVPLAMAYTVRDPSVECFARYGRNAEHMPEANTILVDGENFYYYDAGTRGEPELIDVVPHGAGRFPGSVLRFELPFDSDWHGNTTKERLVDGTVLIGALEAALGFIRRSQAHKQLTLTGDLDGVPQGQDLDPDKPFVADSESPETISLQALDFDTDPKNFLQHISHHSNTLAQAYGGQAQVVEGSGGLLTKVSFSYDALTEIRRKQISFASAFEKDLVQVVGRIARFAGHRLAGRLPSDDALRDGYEVDYPPLARIYSNPKEQADHLEFLLKHGAIDHADLMRMVSGHTLMTREQAMERLKRNINSQIQIYELLAKRNVSMNPDKQPDPNETLAQRNGREGGQTRAANANLSPEEE